MRGSRRGYHRHVPDVGSETDRGYGIPIAVGVILFDRERLRLLAASSGGITEVSYRPRAVAEPRSWLRPGLVHSGRIMSWRRSAAAGHIRKRVEGTVPPLERIVRSDAPRTSGGNIPCDSFGCTKPG